jgi:hypothetical protein
MRKHLIQQPPCRLKAVDLRLGEVDGFHSASPLRRAKTSYTCHLLQLYNTSEDCREAWKQRGLYGASESAKYHCMISRR